MKKTKRILVLALTTALFLGGIKFYTPGQMRGKASDSKDAIPTPQALSYYALTNTGIGSKVEIGNQIPIYSIVQDNGWGANYVKLRDIAFYMDFAVEWDASKPNEMRLYTNKHYLEPLNSTGPATETKTAVKSTMDMYIDDVKVDVDAYIIDNNNFFKIRDLAKAVNFACIYRPGNNSYVSINANYPYVDGDPQYFGTNEEYPGKGGYPYRRIINYEEFTPWYDASSGMHNEPVVNRRDNPWARMDYYAKYGNEVGDLGISERFSDPSVFNAVMQLLIDWDEIRADQSGGWVEGKFVDGLNPNYMYPICKIPVGYVAFGVHVWGREFNGIALELSSKDEENVMYLLAPILNETSKDIGHAGYSMSIQETKEQAKAIYEKMNTLNSDREKITYLSSEVYTRIVYQDFNERTFPSVSETLHKNIFWNPDTKCGGVCEDYVEAFTILCAAAGYESQHLRSDTHAWNVVYLPDEHKWVVVDCTWGRKDARYICMDLDDYKYYSFTNSMKLIEIAHSIEPNNV